ncbi:MAG TPA: adenosylhomocysteinase, partial [Terriglobales bacterium]|nr:adenosylhomocysteinase [Terriglobales bacterium]
MATIPTQVRNDVKSIEFADMGKKRIDWANQSMKVLQIIRKEFIKNQPLRGIRISACLHVTAET